MKWLPWIVLPAYLLLMAANSRQLTDDDIHKKLDEQGKVSQFDKLLRR
jgi:hypothetical protein